MELLELAGTFTVAGILAYAIGGILHVAIDYVHGKRMLRKYWDKTDVKIAGIQESVVAGILEKIPKPPEFPKIPEPPNLAQLRDEILQGFEERVPEIPPVDVGPGLEAFFRSPAGVSWAQELAGVVGRDVEAHLIQKTSTAVGTQARRMQAGAENALLNAAVDFGNPIVNGAWMLLPADGKRQAIRRLVATLKHMGWSLVPITGTTAVELGDSTELEIPGSDGEVWR